MSAPLPALVDRLAVAHETGLPRSVIDRLFEQLPVIVLEGSRKPLVRRADLERLLASRTFPPGAPRP